MNTDKSGTVPVLPMSLFPTMGSMQEVIDYAESQLPITNKNTLMTILMVTQNTILKVQQDEANKQGT